MRYPIPPNEDERLREVGRLRAQEWGVSAALQQICEMASKQLHTPISLVSLVGEKEQCVPAAVGLNADSTPRNLTFCAHAIMDGTPLIVEDTTSDERFADNPLVTGAPGIAAYAGIPLETSKGLRVGTLCAIDVKPHKFNEQDIEYLQDLSQLAVSTIAAHLTELTLADELEKSAAMAEEVAESKLRYELAIRGASVGLWDWNVETDALFWSDRFREIAGIESDDFVPELSSFYERLHPGDRERVITMLKLHLYEKEPYDVEYQLRREKGDYVWIRARGQAVWDENGKPIRMAGSVDDITDRKFTEFELVRHASALERSNRELEDFAAVLSHDLKAPVRRIGVFVPQIMEAIESGDTALAREDYELVVRSMKHMNALIDDLSDYCRLSASPSSHENVATDDVLERVIDLIGPAITDAQADITHDPLPAIRGSNPQIVQLFQNLISNAIKYCSAETPKAHIGVVDHGELWEFSITDNGIGIDAASHRTIFEPFRRLHSASQYSGIGLGLTTCKKIVERHGGQIWCESETGNGTTFYFTIPKAEHMRQSDAA
ncbi:MAG: ATP-binding protein [Rhodomicrobiaceae bacterium]